MELKPPHSDIFRNSDQSFDKSSQEDEDSKNHLKIGKEDDKKHKTLISQEVEKSGSSKWTNSSNESEDSEVAIRSAFSGPVKSEIDEKELENLLPGNDEKSEFAPINEDLTPFINIVGSENFVDGYGVSKVFVYVLDKSGKLLTSKVERALYNEGLGFFNP